jgi:hypothetical protein
VFILKVIGPSPLLRLLYWAFGVSQNGGLPGTPPEVPHPESVTAQAAYRRRHSATAQVRIVGQDLFTGFRVITGHGLGTP